MFLIIESIFSSPDSPNSPPDLHSTTTTTTPVLTSYQSLPADSSSNRSYLRLNKSPLSPTSSNQSTPRSTPKSPLSPSTTGDTIKRSFFRFNSATSNTEKNSTTNSSMGQSGSTKRTQNDIQSFLDKEKEKFIDKLENPIRQNSCLDDFELVRTIGTGSFGTIKNIRTHIFFNYFHACFFLL